jgi:DNA-directed RNA polymerase beta' subunit
MKTFLIALDFYPYYRLPNLSETDLLNETAKESYQETQKEDMLNQALWSAIFVKMKELNRLSVQCLPIRGVPKRLNSTDFNKKTGEIKYPIVFNDPTIILEISRVNIKVKDFCIDKDKEYATYEKAQNAISILHDKIKYYMSVSDDDLLYGEGSSFLRSLEYEIRKLI